MRKLATAALTLSASLAAGTGIAAPPTGKLPEVDPSGGAQLDLEEAIEPGDVTLRFESHTLRTSTATTRRLPR